MTREKVIYQGAAKAIIDGEHPEFEKMIPHLPKNNKNKSPYPDMEDDDDLQSSIANKKIDQD